MLVASCGIFELFAALPATKSSTFFSSGKPQRQYNLKDVNRNTFEEAFRGFVKYFGGELVPEADTKNADFIFREKNVVAELKTLEEDAKNQHDEKLRSLTADWMKRGLLVVFGRNLIRLPKLDPICQREWLSVLQAPVENIIRTANRQIRSTKQSHKIPTAKGLLLIANEGNFLHTSPRDYMLIVARVLQKRKETGEPRFPHIRGVIYFSYQVRSKDEGLPFWCAGQIDPSADADMALFQENLKTGWYSYLSAVTGQRVTEFQAI